MWLKEYATVDGNDSKKWWTYLADDILASNVTKDVKPKERKLRINPLYQTWKPKMSDLPDELKNMMKMAKKYAVVPDGIAISRHVMRQMPMWDHVHADTKKLKQLTKTSQATYCLIRTHDLKTVGDFEKFASKLQRRGHIPRGKCPCAECKETKENTGCLNPHKCFERAKTYLDTLSPKWDPRGEHQEDHEEAQLEESKRTFEEEENAAIFDPRVTTRGNISSTLRIFTEYSIENPPYRNKYLNKFESEGGTLTLATDGSCVRNGEEDAQAGAGVYAGANNALNREIRLPPNIEQTNQTGEGVATLTASEIADRRTPL
ncbi:uncharacterized protein BXZ73DRAFT_12724, partial [Epithele typhae]|uniref:uncharacterized protein n=1 Tax=Epithele typhae TaxID=378194 RepID=UPI0020086D5B